MMDANKPTKSCILSLRSTKVLLPGKLHTAACTEAGDGAGVDEDCPPVHTGLGHSVQLQVVQQLRHHLQAT